MKEKLIQLEYIIDQLAVIFFKLLFVVSSLFAVIMLLFLFIKGPQLENCGKTTNSEIVQ